MNQDFTKLSLTELFDKLSESTALYSKSMLNGLSEKEFAELRLLIETLQKEIAKRKIRKAIITILLIYFPRSNLRVLDLQQTTGNGQLATGNWQ